MSARSRTVLKGHHIRNGTLATTKSPGLGCFEAWFRDTGKMWCICDEQGFYLGDKFTDVEVGSVAHTYISGYKKRPAEVVVEEPKEKVSQKKSKVTEDLQQLQFFPIRKGDGDKGVQLLINIKLSDAG